MEWITKYRYHWLPAMLASRRMRRMVCQTYLLHFFLCICISFAKVYLQDFIHDGKTIYCWETQKPHYKDSIFERPGALTGKGDMCKLVDVVTQINDTVDLSQSFWAGVTWGGQLKAGEWDLTTLDQKFIDSGNILRTVGGIVRVCTYGTDCNPFPMEVGRNGFTTDRHNEDFDEFLNVRFSNKVFFQTPGNYSVMGSFTLINKTTGHRYTFAKFRKVTAFDSTALNTSKDGSRAASGSEASSSSDNTKSQLSKGALAALIVGCIIAGLVLGYFINVVRKLKNSSTHPETQKTAIEIIPSPQQRSPVSYAPPANEERWSYHSDDVQEVHVVLPEAAQFEARQDDDSKGRPVDDMYTDE